MNSTMLVVNLAISIALIIGLILIPKLNPMVSLVIASAYMGISCGLGVLTTMDTIASGFGSMMTSIGLPIGLGVLLGQLMSDTGMAQKIATTLVHAVPARFVMWALAGAGFLLAGGCLFLCSDGILAFETFRDGDSNAADVAVMLTYIAAQALLAAGFAAG